MEFAHFIKYIPKILQQQLPAVSAHLKMAPLERAASLQSGNFSPECARKSAVMMLLYPKNNETHLVLIKRNTYPGIHSSQISFPGGKAELYDNDLAATALRETYEEIGVLPHDIDIVMPFSEIYIPPSNFLVYPFLGIAASEPAFSPNPDEVDTILEIDLDDFLDDGVVVSTSLETSYSRLQEVPAFKLQGHIVWGATAMILSELKETINNALG